MSSHSLSVMDQVPEMSTRSTRSDYSRSPKSASYARRPSTSQASPRKTFHHETSLAHLRSLNNGGEQKESPSRLAAKYKTWTSQHLAAHIKSSLGFSSSTDHQFTHQSVTDVAQWVVEEQLAGRAFFELCEEDIEELDIPLEWKQILLYIWLDLHQMPKYSTPHSSRGKQRSPLPFRKFSWKAGTEPSVWRHSDAPAGNLEVHTRGHMKRASEASTLSSAASVNEQSVASDPSVDSTLIGDAEGQSPLRSPLSYELRDRNAVEGSDGEDGSRSEFAPRALFRDELTGKAISRDFDGGSEPGTPLREMRDSETSPATSPPDSLRVDEDQTIHATPTLEVFSKPSKLDLSPTAEGTRTEDFRDATEISLPVSMQSSRRSSMTRELDHRTPSIGTTELGETFLRSVSRLEEVLASSTHAISSLTERVDQLDHSVSRLERLCATTISERDKSSRSGSPQPRQWHQQITPYAVAAGWALAVGFAHLARSRASGS